MLCFHFSVTHLYLIFFCDNPGGRCIQPEIFKTSPKNSFLSILGDTFGSENIVTFESSFLIGQPIRGKRYDILKQDLCLIILIVKWICFCYFQHIILPTELHLKKINYLYSACSNPTYVVLVTVLRMIISKGA